MKSRIMIVDDDEAVRASLVAILGTYDFKVVAHAGVREALEAIPRERPDCILMDVRMPEIDGLMAQKLISESLQAPPVIMISGHGDIAMAVQALKNGAYDFVEKPIDDEKLVESINSAIAAWRQKGPGSPDQVLLLERFTLLTPREKLIARMVADGFSTQAIASNLTISARTVDHHRANILAKMQATTLPQLIRFLLSIREIH